ncbi:MAG: DsbA family protein [Actinobacteria bacterium]|nr:DsbA family protein [Actinomycetota bacterium]MCA1740262.1 DsbA family protein [Actinomycetota bacterium]
MSVRYYFDLVCPYSYILGFEVEQAEDDGLVEIEWLPFELRPAPTKLPEPRGTYIRDHWRDHVYGLAINHEVEIHVPRFQPRSTLALSLHSFAEEQDRSRAYRDAGHRAFFVEGLNIDDEGVLREVAQEADLDADEAISAAWELHRISGLRAIREEAASIGVPGVPTMATKERVIYYGAASPGKVRAMLADQKEDVG